MSAKEQAGCDEGYDVYDGVRDRHPRKNGKPHLPERVELAADIDFQRGNYRAVPKTAKLQKHPFSRN